MHILILLRASSDHELRTVIMRFMFALQETSLAYGTAEQKLIVSLKQYSSWQAIDTSMTQFDPCWEFNPKSCLSYSMNPDEQGNLLNQKQCFHHILLVAHGNILSGHQRTFRNRTGDAVILQRCFDQRLQLAGIYGGTLIMVGFKIFNLENHPNEVKLG